MGSDSVETSGVQKVRSEGTYNKLSGSLALLARQLTAPLATSRSGLAMLLAGDLGQLSDEQRDYLQQLLQLDDFMIGVVRSWVDMERLAQGQVVLDVEPYNIGTALKAITVPLTLQRRSQWPMVLVDPNRLQQIIVNIAEQFKHLDVRARVTSEVCIVTFHDRSKSNSLLRASILQALNTNGPTTMLGIRIAQLLARAHGGYLRLNPHAGDGIRLHLQLPLAKQMSLLGDSDQ